VLLFEFIRETCLVHGRQARQRQEVVGELLVGALFDALLNDVAGELVAAVVGQVAIDLLVNLVAG